MAYFSQACSDSTAVNDVKSYTDTFVPQPRFDISVKDQFGPLLAW